MGVILSRSFAFVDGRFQAELATLLSKVDRRSRMSTKSNQDNDKIDQPGKRFFTPDSIVSSFLRSS